MQIEDILHPNQQGYWTTQAALVAWTIFSKVRYSRGDMVNICLNLKDLVKLKDFTILNQFQLFGKMFLLFNDGWESTAAKLHFWDLGTGSKTRSFPILKWKNLLRIKERDSDRNTHELAKVLKIEDSFWCVWKHETVRLLWFCVGSPWNVSCMDWSCSCWSIDVQYRGDANWPILRVNTVFFSFPLLLQVYNTHEEMLDACRQWQQTDQPLYASFIRQWVLELHTHSTNTRRTRDIQRIVWHVRRLWHSSICLSQCPLYIDCVHSAGWFASEMPLRLWPVLMKSSIYRLFNWAWARQTIVTDYPVLMPHKEGLASWSNLLAGIVQTFTAFKKSWANWIQRQWRKGSKCQRNHYIHTTSSSFLNACFCRSHTGWTNFLSARM